MKSHHKKALLAAAEMIALDVEMFTCFALEKYFYYHDKRNKDPLLCLDEIPEGRLLKPEENEVEYSLDFYGWFGNSRIPDSKSHRLLTIAAILTMPKEFIGK